MIVLLCFIMPLKAENSEILYLLTEFKSSKYIGNKSYKKKDDGFVLIPGTFSMKFKVVKQLHTETEFEKKTITVSMDVGTDYPFTVSPEVVLVIKKSKENGYELLDWDFVRTVFCVNKELVQPEYRDMYFETPSWATENQRCRFFTAD